MARVGRMILIYEVGMLMEQLVIIDAQIVRLDDHQEVYT